MILKAVLRFLLRFRPAPSHARLWPPLHLFRIIHYRPFHTSPTPNLHDRLHHERATYSQESDIKSSFENESQFWPRELTNLLIQCGRFWGIYGRDHVLLFRVGSFYEIYGSQAQKWSSVLNLKQTSKGNIGFPDKAFHEYLGLLVHTYGERVAVVEQVTGLESSEQRSTSKPFTSPGQPYASGLSRYLDRIYTPGTYPKVNGTPSVLAALYIDRSGDRLNFDTPVFISFYDMMLFKTNHVSTTVNKLRSTLQGLPLSEIIIPRGFELLDVSVNNNPPPIALGSLFPTATCITQRPVADFCNKVHKRDNAINETDHQGFARTRHALVEYLDFVYMGQAPDVAPAESLDGRNAIISKTTTVHLELFKTAIRNSEYGSVSGFLDFTITEAGRHALKRSMMLPSIDQIEITRRLHNLNRVANCLFSYTKIHTFLEAMKVHRPPELICAAIQGQSGGIEALRDVRNLILDFETHRLPLKVDFPLTSLQESIADLSGLVSKIDDAFDFTVMNQAALLDPIYNEPPLTFIQKGYNAACDVYITGILTLQKKCSEFKHSFCAQFGFQPGATTPLFLSVVPTASDDASSNDTSSSKSQTRSLIELSLADWGQVPDNYRGTMTVVKKTRSKVHVYFEPWNRIQDQLRNYVKLLSERERLIVQDLKNQVLDRLDELHKVGRLISELDLYYSFSKFALQYPCSTPTISTDRHLWIEGGYHPVLYRPESHNSKRNVTCNDIELNEHKSLCIISGANMSGKSTVMRMVGLSAIMSQMGCVVPAKKCVISPFDGIYTRFGSMDDIGKDRSTFLIELHELNDILTRATPHSLVLIDELGKSTSREDGTGLFCSVVQELLQRRTFTFMTTHYHDLHKILQKCLPPEQFDRILFRMTNIHISETMGEPLLSLMDYRLVPGVATSSKGLEIARWANLPSHLLDNAVKIRQMLIDVKRSFEPANANQGKEKKS